MVVLVRVPAGRKVARASAAPISRLHDDWEQERVQSNWPVRISSRGNRYVACEYIGRACKLLTLKEMRGTKMLTSKVGKASEVNQPAQRTLRGDIRELVVGDTAGLRRAPDNGGELVAANVTVLLQRLAGTSVQEIDRLIAELETLRDRLRTEGARVEREVNEYANLSNSAMHSTRIILESLASWKHSNSRA